MMPDRACPALAGGVATAGIVPCVASIVAKGRFERRPAPAGRALFASGSTAGAWIEVAGWLAGDLPDELDNPAFVPETGGAGRWRLSHGGTELEIVAAAVTLIEPRPGLLAPLVAPFALKPGERRAARVLLALLRLPGGARLLRAWHARRR